MHDLNGSIHRFHMRLGQGAPTAANRIEHRVAERWGKILAQNRVDPTLGVR